tara:strand:- start:323 stop:1300 length:978 start_codon:yes stop_codon:yes gene_type:complete
MFKNKTVLITGGTGSLGKGLIRRLTSQGAKILIYSRDEAKQAELLRTYPNIIRVIGDVRDFQQLDTTMKIHKPNFVFHTGALKRVDDIEFYPMEGIKTNVIGSDNVARASLINGVERCALISTDKSCQSVSAYGATKLLAERLFTNYDYQSTTTKFCSVRYGNVIASRGSFIPLFLEQINNGETLTLTNTEMSRFLFTLEDAVDAVLDSITNTIGGEVFIPKIKSYTLPTCIKALEQITGKKAKYDMNGLRPGEKLHESMLDDTEINKSYEVTGTNLICIKPQYTKKDFKSSGYNKYKGPVYISSNYISEDIDELVTLIKRGINE